jgi:hypothetical protein
MNREQRIKIIDDWKNEYGVTSEELIDRLEQQPGKDARLRDPEYWSKLWERVEQQPLSDRYKEIVESEWFQKAYGGKSLGEIMELEQQPEVSEEYYILCELSDIENGDELLVQLKNIEDETEHRFYEKCIMTCGEICSDFDNSYIGEEMIHSIMKLQSHHPQQPEVSEKMTLKELESLIRLFATGYVPSRDGKIYNKELTDIRQLCGKLAKCVFPLLQFHHPQSISDDGMDKIQSLNGYLKIWRDGKEQPFELSDLIKEVDEWLQSQFINEKEPTQKGKWGMGVHGREVWHLTHPQPISEERIDKVCNCEPITRTLKTCLVGKIKYCRMCRKPLKNKFQYQPLAPKSREMKEQPIDIASEEAAKDELAASKEKYITGFHIEWKGDPGVGIFPGRWDLEGDTYFEPEDLEKFRSKLSKLFEEYITGEPVGVTTYEERKAEIKAEEKLLNLNSTDKQ